MSCCNRHCSVLVCPADNINWQGLAWLVMAAGLDGWLWGWVGLLEDGREIISDGIDVYIILFREIHNIIQQTHLFSLSIP